MFASSDHTNPSLRPKLVVTYIEYNFPVAGFDYTALVDTLSSNDKSSFANAWWWDFGDSFFLNLQNPSHS